MTLLERLNAAITTAEESTSQDHGLNIAEVVSLLRDCRDAMEQWNQPSDPPQEGNPNEGFTTDQRTGFDPTDD